MSKERDSSDEDGRESLKAVLRQKAAQGRRYNGDVLAEILGLAVEQKEYDLVEEDEDGESGLLLVLAQPSVWWREDDLQNGPEKHAASKIKALY